MGMGGGMGMMGMGGGMMGMGGGGGAGVSGGKRPEARPGDWDCPRCYNLNFSSRSVRGAPASVSYLNCVDGSSLGSSVGDQ
jgi:hypothetical protein